MSKFTQTAVAKDELQKKDKKNLLKLKSKVLKILVRNNLFCNEPSEDTKSLTYAVYYTGNVNKVNFIYNFLKKRPDYYSEDLKILNFLLKNIEFDELLSYDYYEKNVSSINYILKNVIYKRQCSVSELKNYVKSFKSIGARENLEVKISLKKIKNFRKKSICQCIKTVIKNCTATVSV